jgi:hypothetical protein
MFYQYYYINSIKSFILPKKSRQLLKTKSLSKITSSSIRKTPLQLPSKSRSTRKIPLELTSRSSSIRKTPLQIKDFDDKLQTNNFKKILDFYNKITEPYNDETNETNDEYIKKIILSISKYNNYTYTKKIENIAKMLNIIYKLILIDYNNNFFISNKYISPNSVNETIINNLKEKIFSNEYLSFIQKLLIDNYEKFRIVSSSLLSLTTNKIITLPQYSGICWFISFLTGLTYSDKNRKLVISKKGSNLSKIKDLSIIDFETDSNETIFTSFVYFIIENISDISKTYSENLSSDCDIFKYFKQIPELFLKKLTNEEYNKDIDKFASLPQRKKNIESIIYYRNLINVNYAEPKNYIYNSIINIINNIGSESEFYGALKSHYIILKEFYKYLNINCLFIYEFKNKKYVKTDQYNPEIEYDIIIISKNSVNILNILLDNNTTIISDINIDITLKKFKYNDIDYELDYVMQSTDSNKSCKDCGHNICALNYNNKEYYYNSSYSIKNLKCDEDIRLPCSLIEHEWSKNLTDDEYCFSLLKCNYIPDYEYYDENDNLVSKIIIKNSKNICYTNKTGQQFCYVRKNAVQGGKSKKIERKIYMDKKTNKYYVNYDNKKIYLSV